ncbi:hypothetical protein BDQ12DRAFT_698861 [Crucibulum laeve]|uniref:DNA-directed RNA polymerase n=1 Tax=Crucibulum laeve TaxID=68775 RepID=A0A5C3LYH8_9AGAR|nr:hypothetical protein BDQ12DRAFT_698861 [Crucibulum laeve]
MAIFLPASSPSTEQVTNLVTPRGVNIHHSPDLKSSNPVFDDGVLSENSELIFSGLVHIVFHEKRPQATPQLSTELQILLKVLPDMTIQVPSESLVERRLNLARAEDNNIKQMEISACVGQQSMESRWISFGFHHRTLPHFIKDDLSPESRGFVENSYLRGLTPQEFFHAMARREGLIDTALKTTQTSYIQRRLMKALEDVIVYYDDIVRNSLGDRIKFVYGEDGMDGIYIEKQTIEIFRLNNREFEHNYRIDVTDPAGDFLPGVLQIRFDNSSLEFQAKLDEEYMRKPSDLEPSYIVDAVRALNQRFIVVCGDDELSHPPGAAFASRRVLEKFNSTGEASDWVLGEAESKLNPSIVHPEEICGVFAV